MDNMTPDEIKWATVPSPEPRISSTGVPYVEIFDWYPWMRHIHTEYEMRYDAEELFRKIEYASPWLPWGTVLLYIVFCYFGTRVMKNRKPFDLKRPLIVWNFLLASFSIIGALRTVPHLINILRIYGFKYSICANPRASYGTGAVGLWVQLFVLSKFPELGDTFFIVARKKSLIFLHWYHHITVLLYCWHSYYHSMSYGIYFVCMNFTVHGLMYLYYGLKAMGVELCKPYYVTGMQISQMFVGMFICLCGGYYSWKGETQYVSVKNFWAGIIMYASYAVLFLQFFMGRFVKKVFRKGSSGRKASASNGVQNGSTNGSGDKKKTAKAE